MCIGLYAAKMISRFMKIIVEYVSISLHFHQLMFICNITSLFKIVCDYMTGYYLGPEQILHSLGLSTLCANGSKFYVFARVRSCDEKFFQYCAIRDWYVLLVSTTAQTSFSAFYEDLMIFIINH